MKFAAKLMLLTALTSVGAVAGAITIDDAKIMIDRALNSPTLTVKYKGAAAAMVEMKVNGVSVGTRTVDQGKSTGETNFTIDLSTLMEGENVVEVCLYSADGKLIGTEKSSITATETTKGPVYLVSPKVGSTVQGSLDVKVGFGSKMTNKYVSFFVDKQFRGMTNVAPFGFTWDTLREQNGWHELEAWVVDDQGNTFKTRSTKVFVNNPGGRTERPAPVKPPVDLTPSTNGVKAAMGASAGMRTMPAGASSVTSIGNAATPGVTARTAAPGVNPQVSPSTTLKPTSGTAATAMGSRTVTPGVAGSPAKPAVINAVPIIPAGLRPNKPVIEVTNTVNTAVGKISVGMGTRLPNHTGALSVTMYGKPVKCDVAPRVQDGIPIAPFRHLFEADGGKVDWDNLAKAVNATKDGKSVEITIGSSVARVNKIDVDMEMAPFIERGRTMIAMSFLKESLNVEIEYDAATGHVYIRKAK